MDTYAIAFFTVIAIVIVELLLSGRFVRFYFTVGLPIFRRQVECNPMANRPPTTAELEAASKGSVLSEMAFRNLGSSEYAFREAMMSGFFKIHYTPMMHGLMRFDRERRRVLVIGYANWFPVAFVVLFALFVLDAPRDESGFMLAFAGGLVLFIYAIQARRFWQLGTAAAALWSNATVNPLVVDESAIDRPLKAIRTLWKALVVCSIAAALTGMALMLIGTLTEEWTCQEEGSGWKCVGGRECSDEANKRFDGHKRAMSCKRTDWPMVPIEKLGDLLR